MNENPILEQLKREALYAQRSFSTEFGTFHEHRQRVYKELQQKF